MPIPLRKLRCLGVLPKGERPSAVHAINPKKLFSASAARGFYMAKKPSTVRIGEKGITIKNLSYLGGADFAIGAVKVATRGGERIMLIKEYLGSPAVKEGVLDRVRNARAVRRFFEREGIPISIPLKVPHEGAVLEEFVRGRHLNKNEFARVNGILAKARAKNPNFVFHPLTADDFIITKGGRIYWVDVDAYMRK